MIKMATPRITGFLIAVVVASFFVTTFGLLFTGINDNYGTDYDNSSIELYDKLDTMADKAETYQTEISEIKEEQGVLDIIGGFFSSAYNSLLLIGDSYDVVFGDGKMADQALQDMNEAGLGATAGNLRIMVGTIVLILFFVGIIMAVILKRDRL